MYFTFLNRFRWSKWAKKIYLLDGNSNDKTLKIAKKFHNIKLTEVTSPTFNIMNEYNVGDIIIKHYDLFRLKSNKEIKNLNLFESNEQSILLIEWPQIIQKNPKSILKLYFEYGQDYKNRFIKF